MLVVTYYQYVWNNPVNFTDPDGRRGNRHVHMFNQILKHAAGGLNWAARNTDRGAKTIAKAMDGGARWLASGGQYSRNDNNGWAKTLNSIGKGLTAIGAVTFGLPLVAAGLGVITGIGIAAITTAAAAVTAIIGLIPIAAVTYAVVEMGSRLGDWWDATQHGWEPSNEELTAIQTAFEQCRAEGRQDCGWLLAYWGQYVRDQRKKHSKRRAGIFGGLRVSWSANFDYCEGETGLISNVPGCARNRNEAISSACKYFVAESVSDRPLFIPGTATESPISRDTVFKFLVCTAPSFIL